MHEILYCTECGAAYLAETTSCDYCSDASLATEPPPVEELGPWENFMDFGDENERWNVENILRGDGIPTMVWQPEAGLRQIYPGLSLGRESSLRIPRQCFARARACLAAHAEAGATAEAAGDSGPA